MTGKLLHPQISTVDKHLYDYAGSAGTSVALVTSAYEVEKMIRDLDQRFNTLKSGIRQCLEKHRIPVTQVVDVLTSLTPDYDEHHKIFLERHVRVLVTVANNSELFGTMNFHWNYLDPGLLEHLVKELHLDEFKSEMETYKSDLQQFRMKTPLTLFCQTQKRKYIDPPPDFHRVVAVFDLPENVTLEDVEQFRQKYASHYRPHEFAMMVAQVLPG